MERNGIYDKGPLSGWTPAERVAYLRTGSEYSKFQE